MLWFTFYTQVDEDTSDTIELEDLDEDRQNEEETDVHSTKRPLAAKKNPQAAKKKREAQESELLEQAILCMKQDSEERKGCSKKTDDDLFGQFIAAEIQSIRDPYIKRQTKWKIQLAIHEAHNMLYSQQPPVPWPGLTWETTTPMANIPPNSFSQPWKDISPTPSHLSQSNAVSPNVTQHS